LPARADKVPIERERGLNEPPSSRGAIRPAAVRGRGGRVRSVPPAGPYGRL